MNFKKSYSPTIGYTKLSEIGKSSLNQLEFGIIELEDGDSVTIHTQNKEYGFVFLCGHADLSGVLEKPRAGGRPDVFSDRRAYTVYVGRNSTICFTGCEHVEIAVCDTPVDVDTEAQIIPPEEVPLKMLGKQPWERETSFLLDSSRNARRLTVGEGYCTPGNWAGFPPHKHDTDRMPDECVTEEIYFFRFQPEQGFAVQCMYKEGDFDLAYRVKENDFIEFPYGYHTTVSAPGYVTYFLWMMAGDHQGFYRSNDPQHEWVEKA